MGKKIGVGDSAPDFSLPSQTGQLLRLSDFLGRKNVVLYFYPKDYTVGCTIEAKKFRDNYRAFTELGAEVIGVSSDTVEKHKSFAADCEIPFPILSDGEKKVRGLYGVSSTLGLIPGRVTFVIDKGGTVRHVFSSQHRAAHHVDESLNVLKSISA